MSYSTIFTFTVRAESAYAAAQDWIANDVPSLEERFKTAALTATISALKFALTVIEWATDEIEKIPETLLKTRILHINSKRFVVLQLIKVVRFDTDHQISATTRKLWNRKGAIARSVGDSVFQLN